MTLLKGLFVPQTWRIAAGSSSASRTVIRERTVLAADKGVAHPIPLIVLVPGKDAPAPVSLVKRQTGIVVRTDEVHCHLRPFGRAYRAETSFRRLIALEEDQFEFLILHQLSIQHLPLKRRLILAE